MLHCPDLWIRNTELEGRIRESGTGALGLGSGLPDSQIQVAESGIRIRGSRIRGLVCFCVIGCVTLSSRIPILDPDWK